MTISEQLKVLCVRTNISVSELACRMEMSPQNLNTKLKRGTFTVPDLNQIAEAAGTTFERKFVLDDGEDVWWKTLILEEVCEKYKNNQDMISLFSGTRGLDIGLWKAGLNVVIGQDFEPLCVEMMKANGYNVLGRDIGKIKPETLLERTVLHVGEPFMVCGETLCQPFSSAWKRLGINDRRGSLFMDFIRMIDYIRLRFFAMENVKGIVSSPLKHVSTKEFSDDWKFAGTISAQYRQIGNAVPIGLAEAIW